MLYFFPFSANPWSDPELFSLKLYQDQSNLSRISPYSAELFRRKLGLDYWFSRKEIVLIYFITYFSTGWEVVGPTVIKIQKEASPYTGIEPCNFGKTEFSVYLSFRAFGVHLHFFLNFRFFRQKSITLALAWRSKNCNLKIILTCYSFNFNLISLKI